MVVNESLREGPQAGAVGLWEMAPISRSLKGQSWQELGMGRDGRDSSRPSQWRTQGIRMIAIMGIRGIRMANNWVALSPPGGRAWYSMATLSQKPHDVEPTMVTPATKG